MPIDPTAQAASLLATPQDVSPIEHQNRFGSRHRTISNLAPGKFLTVLAIQTPEEIGAERFFEILDWLRATHGVESMETAFAATVPNFGNEYRNDLHLTAHLRAEELDFSDGIPD